MLAEWMFTEDTWTQNWSFDGGGQNHRNPKKFGLAVLF